MKKYIIFGISLVLIVISMVFIETEGATDVAVRELTKEEQIKVAETTDIINDVVNLRVPDINTWLAQAKSNSLFAQKSNPGDMTSMQSVTLKFDINLDADENIVINMENYMGHEAEDVSVKMSLLGECLLTREAVLIDYAKCDVSSAVDNYGGFGIVESWPFKIYISSECVLIYFYKEGNTLVSESHCNRWINLYDGTESNNIVQIIEQSIQAYNDAIFGELEFIGDFFNKNSTTSFIVSNNKFLLKKDKYSQFAKDYANSNLDLMSEVEITSPIYDNLDYEFKKMDGSFCFDLSKDGIIEIEHIGDWEYSVDFSQLFGLNFSADCSEDIYIKYTISKINETVLERPNTNKAI